MVDSYKPDRAGLMDVDARLFMAAHLCASTEEVRYYINGVYVTRHPEGGVILVATDGCRLIVVRDDTGWCKSPVIVRLDKSGLLACRFTKAVPAPRVLVSKEMFARVGVNYASAGKVVIDGTFPDWRRVVPVKKWGGKSASFNGKYIGEFGKIAEILGSQQQCLRVLSDGPSDPALVLFPHRDEAFGILMPMRADVGEGLPAWMKPIMAAKPKVKAAPEPKAKTKARKKK